ncbi:MAG: DUF3137 domain-containing protein [Alphaproteobacteria bacterium]|nr:DUF3137 domain-containing protein [Alphaproteobacteria bacterium]
MKSNVNRELAEIQRQFRAFYEKYLCGDYSELEEKRKFYLLLFFMRGMMLVIFLFYTLCFGLKENMERSLEPLWILVFVLLCFYASVPAINYRKNTKMLMMDKILSFFGDFIYFSSPKRDYLEDVLKQSVLFKNKIEAIYDDCFWGHYKGLDLLISEQKLYADRGLGEVCVFKGILILLKMTKKFDGQAVVRIKKKKRIDVDLCIIGGMMFLGLLIGGMVSEKIGKKDFLILAIGYPLALWLYLGVARGIKYLLTRKNRQKMQQVKLEDVVFDKNWDVEATDQIEARFVLTPAFMERILEVKRRFKGKKIEFSFWKNKVLIAVHTNKDMFETTSLFTSALNYRKMQEVVAQFYSVFSVADVLLNTNKKQGL